ncbi:diguanylate cyclase [Aphanothece hegewaldii CCALA 016]|uniref:Diguanylate cyclase n=2 Tax=Aphanothece TaxID=1121 RepID=A0A2T1LWC8_9CHRO|nr:diguanylate cyclase [Aphanothece hegewaldii CCALA 016]
MTTAREVQSLLQVARVKIYRFSSDGSGEVIAESLVGNSLPSLLGLHFPASDIPPMARTMFLKARQRVIVDVVASRKTLNYPENYLDYSLTDVNLTTSEIRHLPVDPCHLKYLSAMGVASSLAVPILHEQNLWGLLVAHDIKSRHYCDRELKIVQLLMDHLSIAIAQASLLNAARQQATQEATLNKISRLLHSPLKLADIRQTILQVTVEALQGSGGRLYINADHLGNLAQLYTYGEQPISAQLEETNCWQQLLGISSEYFLIQNTAEAVVNEAWELITCSYDKGVTLPDQVVKSSITNPRLYNIEDLYIEPQFQPLVSKFAPTRIRSILIVPLQYQNQCVGCLSIFRNEIETEKLWAGRWHQDDRNNMPRRSFEIWREIKQGQAQAWQPEEIRLADALGTHLYLTVMQKRVEETLRHQSLHDQLTGLPNRLLFHNLLTLALARAEHHGQLLGVMFLDLDRFKLVNDTLGHAAGDLLLQQTAQRLAYCLRTEDTIARWAGDEFTILVPNLSSTEQAINIAQRILRAFDEPFYLEGQELYIKSSIGIAFAPYDGLDAETLLKNADIAMYRTKQQGKNNYQLYAPSMNTKALERLTLENNLYKALKRGEFLLHYQPQIDLNTGQIVGMEALIRWQRDEVELISPAQFIPLAEETGLIVAIGEWVLQTACTQNRAWQLAGLPPLRVAINLSACQFQQGNLVQIVRQILQQTGLDPQYLELEITESIAMQDINLTITVLKELKAMGIYISIDDFGTGYSSLSTLRDFPVDALKIDQSFIRELWTHSSNKAIVKSVIALGHGLGLKLIAEGVETTEQLQFLRSLGCDVAQGYFISRPLSTEAATQFGFVSQIFEQRF